MRAVFPVRATEAEKHKPTTHSVTPCTKARDLGQRDIADALADGADGSSVAQPLVYALHMIPAQAGDESQI